MSIETLSAEDIEEKIKQLLSCVPVTGSITNPALRTQLGDEWSNDLYWTIRNRLIERGELETGRGRGGSVKRVIATVTDVSSTNLSETPTASPEYAKEINLYSDMASVLRSQWSKEQGFDNCFIEIAAKQGSKPTGGKWTRPDITAVGYKTFPYVPGRYLEVVTFEVKPTHTTDVSAVYEALAHRRAATRSYVISHMPTARKKEFEQVIESICDESKKLGIGVIVADDPKNFDTWDVLLGAERYEPDPSRLNEFISQQITQELKEHIVRWFK